MTQATNADSGIREHRIEFVRESTPGVTPDNPAWNLFSDNVDTALVASPDAQIEGQRGVGDVNIQNFYRGPEDNTASIDYHLQKFFTDGSGNALDASGDAILRGADNDVAATHTIVDRAELGGGERVYKVVKGGYPNIGDVSGDPSSGLPIMLSLEYEAKKIRSYHVTQPSGTTLTVTSTSAEDTTQTLTIESDGGTTSEQVTLNGTTAVTTTASFSSIDAFELDAEAQGNVTIEDGSGNTLTTIYGANEYDGVEGDLGVPTLGTGSHASAIGTAYERFLDDEVTRGGSEIAAELRSTNFNVSNNYDKTGVAGSLQQAVHAGQQDAELSATVAGNFEGHEALMEHMRNKQLDVVWTFEGGTVTFKGAALTDVGDIGPSAGDAVSTQDNTFTAQDIIVSGN